MKKVLRAFMLVLTVCFLFACEAKKDPQAVLEECADGTKIVFAEGDSNDSVRKNIGFNVKKVDGLLYEISSDKPEVITNKGIVTKGLEDQNVTITITLKYLDVTKTLEYELKVKAQYSSSEWLDIYGNQIKINFAEGDTYGAVTKDLTVTLPQEEGLNIEATSDKPEVLTTAGKVTRGLKDELVTLTYKMSYLNNVKTVVKQVVVKARELNTIEQVLAMEKGATCEFRGTIIGTHGQGFLMTDGTGIILVFLKKAPENTAGEYVVVKGSVDEYNNNKQITNTNVTIVKEETGKDYTFTGEQLDLTTYATNMVQGKKVYFNGKVTDIEANKYVYFDLMNGAGKVALQYPSSTDAFTIGACYTVWAYTLAGKKNDSYTVMLDSYKLIADAPFEIKLDTDGGNEIKTIKFFDFNNVVLPTPVKADNEFVGWYIGETKVETITENKSLELKAKWRANVHYVDAADETKYPTIAKALEVALAGDTIKVAKGSYEGATIDKENITIVGVDTTLDLKYNDEFIADATKDTIITTRIQCANGTTLKGFVFTGDVLVSNVNNVTIDTVVNASSTNESINIQGTLENITVNKMFKGGTAGRAVYVCVAGTDCKNITVTNCVTLKGDATADFFRNDYTYGNNVLSGTVKFMYNHVKSTQGGFWDRTPNADKYIIANNIFEDTKAPIFLLENRKPMEGLNNNIDIEVTDNIFKKCGCNGWDPICIYTRSEFKVKINYNMFINPFTISAPNMAAAGDFVINTKSNLGTIDASNNYVNGTYANRVNTVGFTNIDMYVLLYQSSKRLAQENEKVIVFVFDDGYKRVKYTDISTLVIPEHETEDGAFYCWVDSDGNKVDTTKEFEGVVRYVKHDPVTFYVNQDEGRTASQYATYEDAEKLAMETDTIVFVGKYDANFTITVPNLTIMGQDGDFNIKPTDLPDNGHTDSAATIALIKNSAEEWMQDNVITNLTGVVTVNAANTTIKNLAFSKYIEAKNTEKFTVSNVVCNSANNGAIYLRGSGKDLLFEKIYVVNAAYRIIYSDLKDVGPGVVYNNITIRDCVVTNNSLVYDFFRNNENAAVITGTVNYYNNYTICIQPAFHERYPNASKYLIYDNTFIQGGLWFKNAMAESPAILIEVMHNKFITPGNGSFDGAGFGDYANWVVRINYNKFIGKVWDGADNIWFANGVCENDCSNNFITEEYEDRIKNANGFTNISEDDCDDLYLAYKVSQGDASYKLTVDLGYGEEPTVYDYKEVTEIAQHLTEPTRDGYKFLGWFVGDKAYETPAAGKDLTVVAKWESLYGTLDDPLTVSELLERCKDYAKDAVSDEPFYVIGKISTDTVKGVDAKIVDTNDSTKELLLFWVYESVEVPYMFKGDVVVVYGYIKNYNGDTLEIHKENELTPYYAKLVEGGDATVVLDAESDADATVVFSKQAGKNGDSFTFTVTPIDGKKVTKVTINGNEVQDVEGVYTSVMYQTITVKVVLGNVGEKSYVNKAEFTFNDTTNRPVCDATEEKWVNGDYVYDHLTGSGSSKANNYPNAQGEVRVYKDNTLEILCTNGTFRRITILCNTDGYASALVTAVGEKATCTKETVDGKTLVTIDFAEDVSTTGVMTFGAQCRIAKVTIYTYE